MKKTNSTAFIGLSHLGLVVSIGMASVHPPIIGIDKDQRVIKSLKKGKLLITEDGVEMHERGLPELFRKVKKNYYPTTDFSKVTKCNAVFFSKDTPKTVINPQDEIFSLIKRATPFFRNGVTIVIMSQVPIGFCREVKRHIAKNRPDISFSLYHWVDTIVMTNAINRFLKPERIIIGSEDSAAPINSTLHSLLKLFPCPVFNMSYESAELAKAAINLYLANSVIFANALSDFCENYGGNINEIIPALRSDKRIGQFAYITPGLRISGGHLERDLSMLSRLLREKNIGNGLVDFIIKQNEERYKWIHDKLNKYLFNKVKNPTICVWGLSYKKDSTSTKNATSIKLIESFSGKVKFNTYDPMAIMPKNLKGYKRFKDKYEALKKSDSLIILTDWDQFRDLQARKAKKLMRGNLIIDNLGILNNKTKDFRDFIYIVMGVGKHPV